MIIVHQKLKIRYCLTKISHLQKLPSHMSFWSPWISLNTFKYKGLFLFTDPFQSVTKSTTRFSWLLASFQSYANSDTSFSNLPRTDRFRSPVGFSLIRTWLSWKLSGASLFISLLITKKKRFARAEHQTKLFHEYSPIIVLLFPQLLP